MNLSQAIRDGLKRTNGEKHIAYYFDTTGDEGTSACAIGCALLANPNHYPGNYNTEWLSKNIEDWDSRRLPQELTAIADEARGRAVYMPRLMDVVTALNDCTDLTIPQIVDILEEHGY